MGNNNLKAKKNQQVKKEPTISSEIQGKTSRKKEGFWSSLVFAFLIAISIRSFAVEAFRIPSGSMKNSLLVGDYLFVNKLAYGFKTPKYIPLTNIRIPYFGFNTFDITRGDVVVFEYPGDRDEVIPHEVNVNYIKRCVGLPGDIIEVRSKQVYVNGEMMKNPDLMITTTDTIPKGRPELGLFPKGNNSWNRDNYGPIRIPKKGDVIALDQSSYDNWNVFIQREGHSMKLGDNSAILIDEKPVKSYTVERDYLWMMGDNRDNSEDSRTWGFAPRENVVGKPLFIYWSMFNPPYTAPNEGDPDEVQKFNIRWGRILNGVR